MPLPPLLPNALLPEQSMDLNLTSSLHTAEEVTCPDLPPPNNGQVEFTTNIGDTATYTCDEGYELSGEVTRLCLPDGVWNGSEPTCNCKCSLSKSIY